MAWPTLDRYIMLWSLFTEAKKEIRIGHDGVRGFGPRTFYVTLPAAPRCLRAISTNRECAAERSGLAITKQLHRLRVEW